MVIMCLVVGGGMMEGMVVVGHHDSAESRQLNNPLYITSWACTLLEGCACACISQGQCVRCT